jgi:hypothetical protein
VPAALGAVYRPFVVIVPPFADQVTAVLELPLTAAVNCCDPPLESDAEPGEIVTETVAVAVTLTAAEADLLVSAMLVAVTTKLPALMGAVYIPPEEMFPPLAFQLTAVLLVPLTLAANCWLLPNGSDDELGNTATATETGADNPEP